LHAGLAEISRAGERASNMTRQLLAFSRKQLLRPTVLTLNSVLAERISMLQRLLGEDITLVTVFDADLGAVRADVGQIDQVIMNLALNARDAMPDGGKLTLTTRNVFLDESVAPSRAAAQRCKVRDILDAM
jgi:signal transduction histidine kinase